MKRVRAAIFDLFGTLVFDRFSSRHFNDLIRHLAAGLGADEGRFRERWKASFGGRATGAYASIASNFTEITEQEGLVVGPEILVELERHFHQFTFESMAPVPGALEVLRDFKSQGIKLGLMSDCACAVPAVWARTAFAGLFDAELFSCQLGMRKPAPAFYERCVGLLGVEANECLYVGDGGGNEMAGAMGQGMRPVLVPSLIDPLEPSRVIAKDWQGERVNTFTDLLSMSSSDGL